MHFSLNVVRPGPERMGHNTCKSMGGVLCVVIRYESSENIYESLENIYESSENSNTRGDAVVFIPLP